MKHLSKIFLKRANFPDIEFLWYLRNQPDVYKYSINNRQVSWQEHISWAIPTILGLVPRDVFIIKQEKLPIGSIRFNYEKDKKAKVSIAILKEFRRKGLGQSSFKKAISILNKENKAKQVLAEVHKDNIPSQKFFEKLGFEFKREFKLKGEKWLEYVLGL